MGAAQFARSVPTLVLEAERRPVDDLAHNDEPPSGDGAKQALDTSNINELMQQDGGSTARVSVTAAELSDVEPSTQDVVSSTELQSPSFAEDGEIAVELPSTDTVPTPHAEVDRIATEYQVQASVFDCEASTSMVDKTATNAIYLQLHSQDVSVLQTDSGILTNGDVSGPRDQTTRSTLTDLGVKKESAAVTEVDAEREATTQLSRPNSAIITKDAVAAEREVPNTDDELTVNGAQRSCIEQLTETTVFMATDCSIAATPDPQDQLERSAPDARRA